MRPKSANTVDTSTKSLIGFRCGVKEVDVKTAYPTVVAKKANEYSFNLLDGMLEDILDLKLGGKLKEWKRSTIFS